ncbi:hypothetical protein GCK72_021899 [Caenorhabditis remanei]|uniref:Uncharacterized protein n=1 Tax=Caenorhabditis remanei TaxID=31234 RepID=A0A6A5GJA4_CAERE|nr:hypothetical protein GCK72_021899 [Caenorhabditis remanei]KAF1755330.1 hypothetical protein GCK72_021899 [Caenorhabditis remanei]
MRLLLTFCLLPILCAAFHGTVHVSGQLKCNGQPYVEELVQVWEHKFIGHEVWFEEWTDRYGNFSITASGHEHGFSFSVYPYIWIPNYCGTEKEGDYRCTKNLVQIYVPKDFVSYADHPRVYNIGTVDLEKAEGKSYRKIEKIFGYHQECRSY